MVLARSALRDSSLTDRDQARFDKIAEALVAKLGDFPDDDALLAEEAADDGETMARAARVENEPPRCNSAVCACVVLPPPLQ